ncbi:MAG: sulfotransferase [Agarilytica sp.]
MDQSETHEATPTPFFLVGAVRSGTTLLRLMLGHHPEICLCEEMEYVAPYIPQFLNSDQGLEPYREALSIDKGFRLSGYELLDSDNFEEVVTGFFRQRMQQDQKPLVGSVVHHDFENLTQLWPNAKFMYLSRDPRDVARSSVKMGWHGSAWGGASIWETAYDSWVSLKKQLPESQLMEVPYPKLVAEPEQELERICEFLGVSFTPEMMEIDKDTTYSKPNPKAARSWRDSASKAEVRQVEARVRDKLQEAGFELSEYPPLSVSGLNLTLIELSDLVNRVLFRCKRYGFTLWLSNVLAPRLGLKDWNKKVKMQIQAIEIQHHK